MTEREIKIMLTAEEFMTLTAAMCKYAMPRVQTNYYFDTEDRAMNKQGVTCRIRYRDGKYTYTVKRHHADRPELSTERDLCETERFDATVFSSFGLYCYGCLTTQRVILHEDDAVQAVLDCNAYLGKTDFELEIEYCEDGRHRAWALLEKIAECLSVTDTQELITRGGSAKSKSQRFFERMTEKGETSCSLF